ncbi:eukaryotic translation initiation factor 3 subunit B-like [Oppia nitens]|uniref:eukaryotic translation initiation factor 3 subunit B-like n=1 Tax=Oppia nitens TaxID=1686743 RepID=UPI0023DAE050|nr:eukaryotic translation initiation factor 3 subunit B-like [Oppia nitens]
MASGDLQAVDDNDQNNDIQLKKQHLENGFHEEPDFSDPEDFVDDITDEDLLSHLLRQKPTEQSGLQNVVIVDRIPQVGPERAEKLKTVLFKLFSKCGKIMNEFYPLDETNQTKGYVFFEYENPEQALDAVKTYDGHKLDKQHVFAVNQFTDIDKYVNIPDEIEDPQIQEYSTRGNLYYWLFEPECYDQYSVLYEAGEMTAVFLNSTPEPSLLKERKLWTEQNIQWSPLGTYMATFHKRGIALWGGEDFTQLARFAHDSVNLIDFSPCEKYITTLSQQLVMANDANAIIIWDIRTQTKKRAFSADPSQHLIWPIFKWSFDDKYFARIYADSLSIYETPSFGLLDKKSTKIAGIRNFTWSPSQNILAYWVAEDQNVPARVTLIEIPSRNEIRAKNLFNVADCKMHWQKCGDYLCVKVDRYTKAKKEKNEFKYSGMYFNFEVFHMREKQIPVDSLEIKEQIVAFSWEPVGNKFAIIHGEGPSTYSVSFYGIKSGVTVSLLKKFDSKQCNHLFWSPSGQFIVLASLRSTAHTLEFIDTSDFTITNTTDHFQVTDVEWDPTGRYVTTGVSNWAHKVDNSYWLWSFQGRLIRKHNLDRFCQLLWRPRPPTLLSDEKIKEIKKNLKQYSAQFDIKDRMALSKVSKDMLEKRQKLMKEFEENRQKNERMFNTTKKRRNELRSEDNIEDKEDDETEETVEFLIKEEITTIDENDD